MLIIKLNNPYNLIYFFLKKLINYNKKIIINVQTKEFLKKYPSF